MDEVALPMLLYVTLSGEDCHWMLPELPDKVSVVLFVPELTVAEPETVPATEPMDKVIASVVFVVPLVMVIVPV